MDFCHWIVGIFLLAECSYFVCGVIAKLIWRIIGLFCDDHPNYIQVGLLILIGLFTGQQLSVNVYPVTSLKFFRLKFQ